MIETMIVVFVFLGSVFMVIAAIGIVRLPDLFMRMSANTKAASLGVGLILLAAALYFDDSEVTSRIIAVIVFLLLTSPVAAHMIGRAAYFDGVPLWKGTIIDELKGHYNIETHDLEAPEHETTPEIEGQRSERKKSNEGG